MNRLMDDFRNPPPAMRPAPQWSWNGDLTEARICEQLDQFSAQGCGGLFAHARPGHITGYLTDRWFELWAYAMREAARRGLAFHIYDEFMCPGGDAGGNLVAADPTLAQRELRLLPMGVAGEKPAGEVMFFVKATAGGGMEPLPGATDATHAVVLAPTGPGRTGFPPPDVCGPAAAERFLASTHERYRQAAGDAFGTHVRFMFCDEPALMASHAGLPCSRFVMKAFHAEHGYGLEDRLASLCFPRADSPEVRHDFWKTMNRLFNANFMKPLHEWCERNGLLFTGHLMEHEWPSPLGNPDNMASLRWMHAPGEDLLGFQFKPTALRDNGIYLLNLKELSSVVNQLGRDWSLVETCGGGGYGTAFAYFKPCEDFTLSFGVNVIDTHLAHQSVAGLRKYDWPQTLSDHSPWWRHFRVHADHVARVNTVLSRGREVNRVLVLMPTTSAWMHATGLTFDKAAGGAAAAELARIRESQVALVTALYEQQIDFDLGDEFLLEEFGRADGGRLVVGERAYDAVVLPPAMATWNRSTLRLMDDWLARGGTLYALRGPPERIDARPCADAQPLAGRPGWIACADAAALVTRLRAALPPRLAGPGGAPLPPGLVWRRAQAGDDTAWFLCNPWTQPLETTLEVEGRSVRRCDTATGAIEPTAAVEADGRLRLRVRLEPRGHLLLLTGAEAGAGAVSAAEPAGTPVAVELRGVERRRPNLLYVDYCDLEANGRSLRDVNTARADMANWPWQGYDGNPWEKPFRRTAADRQPDPDSDLTVRYRFASGGIGPEQARALRIGIERPWLYRAAFNGHALDTGAGERWFDEHMRSFPIGAWLRDGENVLELSARPFPLLGEIAPVYVIGDFAAEPAGRGFTLAPARAPALGDWTRQGLPFYADAVRYRYRFHLPAPAPRLRIRAADWTGSVAVVLIDGRELAPLMHPPFDGAVPGPLAAGEHELAVDVLGNMKNMMGSHHIESLPLKWTFEYAPAPMPPGSAYRLWPSGLTADPLLFAG